MNKQGKLIDSKVVGGIEWVKTILPNGTERQGYTWNPIGGCQHGCRWLMPDGQEAVCYAETTADSIARQTAGAAYGQGFAHHYWHSKRLYEPLRVTTPSKIFLDSMSDLMGHWVPDEQVQAVLDICGQASHHTFQLLTKNAPRLLKFTFPPNVWLGVSAPPSHFMGKALSLAQQAAYVKRALAVLAEFPTHVTWMSIEPLSFDMAPLLQGAGLKWAVVGAASNGPRYYQPEPEHLRAVIDVLDANHTAVFYKGNLRPSLDSGVLSAWREEFPHAGH